MLQFSQSFILALYHPKFESSVKVYILKPDAFGPLVEYMSSMNCCLRYALGGNAQMDFFMLQLFPGSISTKQRLGQLKVGNTSEASSP